MIKLLLIAITFTLNVFAADTKLGLNDVSILLPLPQSKEWDLLPKPETMGGKGALLIREIFNQVPQLLAFASNDEVYSAMRAVGIRIDPCFTEGYVPVRCQTQIRLIWQPLSDTDNETSTFDASLHTFYQLTETEFKSLVDELKKLKATAGGGPDDEALGVNPIIKSQTNQSVLPIKPAIFQTGKPGITVANNSACASK